MNVETLIDNKIKLIEAGAKLDIGIGLVTIPIVIVTAYLVHKKVKKIWEPTELIICTWVLAGFVLAFFIIILISGIYTYNVAALKAMSELSNYNLVEIKK